MNSTIILWVYIALLVAGGLMGLIKAGSKASIISSTLMAIPLAAVALGHLPIQVAWVEIGSIGFLFLFRYLKSRKPMPAIPMIAASAIALTLLLLRAR
jgi:uncharacterized membrane protein (UPF0136 family)